MHDTFASVSLWQPMKAMLPTESAFGKLAVVSFEYENAVSPTESAFGAVMLYRSEFLNAQRPMLVTWLNSTDVNGTG